MKGKDVVRLYRNVTLKVLTQIHSRNLKILAACFSETTIKLFSAIKKSLVYLIILPVTRIKCPVLGRQGTNVDGTTRELFKVLSWCLPGKAEEITKKMSQDNR